MSLEAPWKSTRNMDKKTLQIAGALLLIAGLVLGSIGAYGIATNLPVSDEQPLAEAKKAVTPGNGPSAGQRDESLEANVEFQVWKSALQVTNRVRAEKRSQGSIFLLCGFIPVIWGMTLLYNSR